MFRILIAAFIVTLVSCAGKTPQTQTEPPVAPITPTIIRDTIRDIRTDTLTLKMTDSVFIRETESFKALQKSIDSLLAKRETEKAIELLKQQVQYHNNLDQLGFRTLQLANLLNQIGHSAEAVAILEGFVVYKTTINYWIDSANTLYDKIIAVNKSGSDSSKLEVINSLTSQIRNLKNANASPVLITDLADSLRSIAPGDSVLLWLEKQLPSQTESSDSFCEEQRKIAADKFATARKNKAKANALLGEAIEALDRCLAKTPSVEVRKKVIKNKEDLTKELKM